MWYKAYGKLESNLLYLFCYYRDLMVGVIKRASSLQTILLLGLVECFVVLCHL